LWQDKLRSILEKQELRDGCKQWNTRELMIAEKGATPAD
jgi:hypothetical protein